MKIVGTSFNSFYEVSFSLGCSVSFFQKKLGFTPCKAQQPLKGMEFQEKEAQKD